MPQKPNKVDDGRLVRAEGPNLPPPSWRHSPLHRAVQGEVGGKYVWEPGDMTRYEMTVMWEEARSGTVLVIIKEVHVTVPLHVPLSRDTFTGLFKDLPHIDSLPLVYQYMRALSYTHNIPLADFESVVEPLRKIQYRAFWPIDKRGKT